VCVCVCVCVVCACGVCVCGVCVCGVCVWCVGVCVCVCVEKHRDSGVGVDGIYSYHCVITNTTQQLLYTPLL
jgi:hypothetical protein